MKVNHKEILTIGDLKKSGYKTKKVKDELRDNLLKKIKSNEMLSQEYGGMKTPLSLS